MSKRKRVLGVFLGVFLTASVAFGVWAAIDIIEGEGSTTAGKASTISVPIKVAFLPAEGFTPEPTGTCGPAQNCEGGENMNATIEAPVGTTAHEITAFTTTITDTKSGEGCPASSFILTSTDPGSKEVVIGAANKIELKTALKLAAGKSTVTAWGAGNVKIDVTESAPQACEVAGVKVKLVAN